MPDHAAATAHLLQCLTQERVSWPTFASMVTLAKNTGVPDAALWEAVCHKSLADEYVLAHRQWWENVVTWWGPQAVCQWVPKTKTTLLESVMRAYRGSHNLDRWLVNAFDIAPPSVWDTPSSTKKKETIADLIEDGLFSQMFGKEIEQQWFGTWSRPVLHPSNLITKGQSKWWHWLLTNNGPSAPLQMVQGKPLWEHMYAHAKFHQNVALEHAITAWSATQAPERFQQITAAQYWKELDRHVPAHTNGMKGSKLNKIIRNHQQWFALRDELGRTPLMHVIAVATTPLEISPQKYAALWQAQDPQGRSVWAYALANTRTWSILKLKELIASKAPVASDQGGGLLYQIDIPTKTRALQDEMSNHHPCNIQLNIQRHIETWARIPLNDLVAPPSQGSVSTSQERVSELLKSISPTTHAMIVAPMLLAHIDHLTDPSWRALALWSAQHLPASPLLQTILDQAWASPHPIDLDTIAPYVPNTPSLTQEWEKRCLEHVTANPQRSAAPARKM